MITQLNIRIDKTLHTEAKMFCLQRNLLLEDMVTNAITEYMENTEKDARKGKKKDNLID